MKKILLTIITTIALLFPSVSYGQVTAPAGGTGLSTYSAGDIIYAATTNPIRFTKLPIGSNGTCLGVSSLLPAWISCGSGGGTWTTTVSSVASQLINYSNNNTDIVTVGGTSTSTASFIFDPNTGTSTLKNVVIRTINGYTALADTFPGANMGAKLIAATAAIPKDGGTVDARGIVGAQSISSANFSLGNIDGRPITYIFGPATTTVSTTVSGIGVYDNVSIIGNNTTFMALNPNVSVNTTGSFFYPYTMTTTGTITAGSRTLTVADASYIKVGKTIGILGGLGASSGQATTLNGAIADGVATSLTLASATGFGNQSLTFIVDSEIMTGTVSGTSVTGLTRGQYGTTAVGHSSGAAISLLRGLVTRVTAVSGTTITLEDTSSLSLTSTAITIGSQNISLEGQIIVDGKWSHDAADSGNGGILAQFTTNLHVGNSVIWKNFDHAAISLRNSWYNDIGGYYTGIGHPDTGLGFGIILFLQSSYNNIHPQSVYDSGRFAIAIDDRTSGSDQYDGAGINNIVDVGSITATSSIALGDGLLLQGSVGTRVSFGTIYTPAGTPVEIDSAQWATQPNTTGNTVIGGSMTGLSVLKDNSTSVNNSVYAANMTGSRVVAGDTNLCDNKSCFGINNGYGTTTPTAKLQVVGTLNQTSNLFEVNAVGASYATTTQLFIDSLGLGVGTSTHNSYINIARSNASGGLGININNYLSQFGVDTQFLISPYAGASRIGGFLFTTHNGASGDINALTLSAAGFTGVGTTSPSTQLYVQKASSGTVATFDAPDTPVVALKRNNSSTASGAYVWLNNVGTQAAQIAFNNLVGQGFEFNLPTTNIAFLNTTGFGIGTTSPHQKLTVNGNAYIAGFVTSTSTTQASTFPYASTTAFTASDVGYLGSLLVTGSSTLQNFTAVNSTTTNATSTTSFATNSFVSSIFQVGTTSSVARVAIQGAGSGTGINFLTANSVGTPIITAYDNGNIMFGTSTIASTVLDTYTFGRAGGVGALGININNYLSQFGRDIQFICRPYLTTAICGYLFTVHNGAGGDVAGLAITQAGKVGIGSSTPLTNLMVSGNVNTPTNPPSIAVENQNTNVSGGVGIGEYDWMSWDTSLTTVTGSPISGRLIQKFETGNFGNQAHFDWYNFNSGFGGLFPVLTIDTFGNVGFGTTSPTAKLDVTSSPGSALPLLQLNSSSAAYATTTQLTVLITGNTGIGTTTPKAVLQVVANSANSTTTVEFGRADQNKGTCIKLYDETGVAYYLKVAVGGTLNLSTTACASVTGF